ncbi:SLC13 family permease [Agrobacterium sp. AGB01]|uniref:SLC13 family permease n=1 Tax=Agrobacterium sp. AGB01 TaxID=2769302 RepID=UPI001783E77F|nr:SLC13 family permease [Agrobacterium sp. AGB01]MBD9387002.1 SLC13 family permease [Agrobacterium sp. AGB01]
MTTDQILAFAVIAAMMAAFIWDKLRYDVVACSALLGAVAVGIVPFDKAFSGFSDDIVIIVASALIVSTAVARSGIVDTLIKKYFPEMRSKGLQLAFLMIVVAVMSAFIKNIGALAIMMPVAFQFARKSGSPVSFYLMPMAFAALLGGLMTQIGTSPNIVVSRLREEMTGQSFSMFDFTPVGLGLTVIGILFLTFGYRLLPVRTKPDASVEDIMEKSAYTAEASITADSPIKDKSLNELLKQGDGAVIATTILRGHRRISPFPDVVLKVGDTLLLEGNATDLDRVVSSAKLTLSGKPLTGSGQKESDVIAMEAVIDNASILNGLSAKELALSYTRGVNLIAVSRRGHRLNQRLSDLSLMAGDVIVLQGNSKNISQVLKEFDLLPLAQREILLGTRRRAILPLLVLAAAMAAAATGIAPVAVAFFAAAFAMIAIGAIPLSDIYKSVDGPILVMLAALIPVSDTLRTTGASDLIATWLGETAKGMPPFMALGLILLAAMAVTPFLNNAATVLVMGPIAAGFATTLGFKPEAFLMAVAIGAGCDFLTPIGHQCNTLVMGPGGYRFSDYPRLGLPLSFLIIIASIPMLLYVWPAS